jgi:hypothetical protein
LATTEPDDPDWVTYANGQAIALGFRFERSGQAHDLDRALGLMERALAGTDSDDPNRVHLENNLLVTKQIRQGHHPGLSNSAWAEARTLVESARWFNAVRPLIPLVVEAAAVATKPSRVTRAGGLSGVTLVDLAADLNLNDRGLRGDVFEYVLLQLVNGEAHLPETTRRIRQQIADHVPAFKSRAEAIRAIWVAPEKIQVGKSRRDKAAFIFEQVQQLLGPDAVNVTWLDGAAGRPVRLELARLERVLANDQDILPGGLKGAEKADLWLMDTATGRTVGCSVKISEEEAAPQLKAGDAVGGLALLIHGTDRGTAIEPRSGIAVLGLEAEWTSAFNAALRVTAYALRAIAEEPDATWGQLRERTPLRSAWMRELAARMYPKTGRDAQAGRPEEPLRERPITRLRDRFDMPDRSPSSFRRHLRNSPPGWRFAKADLERIRQDELSADSIGRRMHEYATALELHRSRGSFPQNPSPL